jgi:hypothetical protein
MVYRQERKRWALKLVKMPPKKAKDYLQQRIGNALNAEMLIGLGGRLVTYAMLLKLETWKNELALGVDLMNVVRLNTIRMIPTTTSMMILVGKRKSLEVQIQ